MSRLSKNQLEIMDATYFHYSFRHGYEHYPSLTAGKAKLIIKAGKQSTGLIGQSIVNKALSLEMVYKIFNDYVLKLSDTEILNFLSARNIVREFGKYFKDGCDL